MKPLILTAGTPSNSSFPSWERGLKHVTLWNLGDYDGVVPLVGTWIETPIQMRTCRLRWVVPLVGTWIETGRKRRRSRKRQPSFPSWERGLKLACSCAFVYEVIVVPLVGTWIETRRSARNPDRDTSFPSWERGLKPLTTLVIAERAVSFPSWERGLKR